PPPIGAEALYTDYDEMLRKPMTRDAGVPRSARAGSDDELDDHLAAEEEMVADKGAAPLPSQVSLSPPAPAPAPGSAMPQAPAPAGMPTRAMAKRRSLAVSTLVGGVLEGGAAAVAAAFARSSGDGLGDGLDNGSDDEVDDLSGGQHDAGYGGAAPQAEPRGVVAGRDLLEYGALQLQRPDHAQRGRLRRVETHVLYQRWTAEQITIDVIASGVFVAEASARALENTAPPPGHHWINDGAEFDYAYIAQSPVDIASDGKLVSLSLASHPAKATPRYISVPQETQDVFRIVAIHNPLDAPLLPGPVDVYVAGKFTLTSDMETTPPRGRFELGLGVEQAIKIARNVDFQEDTSGLIKRSQELVHTIRIDITNNTLATALIEVRERIPVTTEGPPDLEVEERDISPPWDEYEPTEPVPLEGGRVWKVEVAAGGKQVLRATWLARVPSQHELIGGNRRGS
ncbi:MAG: DUF4139 domain-containing protein, partial [Nannocystaceae bacterium]|nr:DUF4139 domain-containing protein [Nannocystaceae bacterium]